MSDNASARPGRCPAPSVNAVTHFSVLLPYMCRTRDDLLPVARLVDDGLADRIWQGQAMLVDPFHAFAAAAGAGHRVPAGLSVAITHLQHPFMIAMQARSLAALTGHPVELGLGPGPDLMHDLLRGEPDRTPRRTTADYLRTVRDVLAGTTHAGHGQFRCDMPLLEFEAPPVRLGLGVLRPRMARTAGELADTAITWLTPPSYVGEVIAPELHAGAASAGRPRPKLSCIVPVALRREGRNPYRAVLASNYGHLTAPHYQDMLRRAGVTVDLDRLGPTAKALVDSGAFVAGDLDDIWLRIRDFLAAGADEIILNLTGIHNLEGREVAVQELRTLLAELRTRALEHAPV